MHFQDCVWGVGYHIGVANEAQVRQHLDFREKCGYDAARIIFHPQDQSIAPFHIDIYIGNKDNPYFLGPASLEEMAHQIRVSEGKSGKNTEYLFELADTVKALMPEVNDAHLFALEAEVKRICNEKVAQTIPDGLTSHAVCAGVCTQRWRLGK